MFLYLFSDGTFVQAAPSLSFMLQVSCVPVHVVGVKTSATLRLLRLNVAPSEDRNGPCGVPTELQLMSSFSAGVRVE